MCGFSPVEFLRLTDPWEQAAIDAVLRRAADLDRKRLEHHAYTVAKALSGG